MVEERIKDATKILNLLRSMSDYKPHYEIIGNYRLIDDGVRPEATILTYSHAAFTVRQILYAPVDEPGIVMLLEVDSVLPLTITGSFRPRLKLMWPAGLMTPNLEWDEKALKGAQ